MILLLQLNLMFLMIIFIIKSNQLISIWVHLTCVKNNNKSTRFLILQKI